MMMLIKSFELKKVNDDNIDNNKTFEYKKVNDGDFLIIIKDWNNDNKTKMTNLLMMIMMLFVMIKVLFNDNNKS